MKTFYFILLSLPLLHACSTLSIPGAQVGFIDKNISPPNDCKKIIKLSESNRNEKKENARNDIHIELKNKAAEHNANLLILDNDETQSYLKGLTIKATAYKCKNEDLISIMSSKNHYIY